MTTAQVISDIQWLYGKLAARDTKYLRNYNRFLANGQRRENIRTVYTTPNAYFNAQTDEDTGVLPCVNVGRSMVLTLLSKLIQTKGRIFFSPTNGLWDTIKVCRNAQLFFDEFIDRDDVNTKVRKSVLDGLVFDLGVAWIDDESKCIYRVKPWCFYVDPAELDAGKVSRCYMMEESYPLNALKDKLTDKTPETAQLLRDDWLCKVKIYRYWDLIGKKRYLFVNSELIEEKDIYYDVMPFALFFYADPIKGLYSNSVMDNAYQNQRQIDDILRRIHDALTLSPANTVYIPRTQGTNDNLSKMISNKVGNVVPYDPVVGPVVIATPPPIDPTYLEMLQYFEKTTFEQEGVSQLSAQSKKPAGVTAGVALDTLQDIESERFQTQVDSLIKFYRDIYTIMIKVFPKNEEILPKRRKRAKVSWGQIVDQFDNYSMTSSLASVLSKDPATKLDQIEKLRAGGIINQNMIASLLQLPDLEGAYSAATASYDDCMKIIERALDDERFDFYPVVNLKQLLDESVNILLQLDAVDEDPRILDRLVKLIDIVMVKLNAVGQAQAPAQPPTQPPQDVQGQALNGAQVTSLLEIVEKVTAAQVPPTVAAAMISSAFPAIPPDQIQIMVGLPPSPPPGPQGAPPSPDQGPPPGPIAANPSGPPQGPQIPT